MMLLGLSWFRQGNYLRASELLSGVGDSQSTDANLYYALASSLIKLGKVDAADRVMEQLKTLGVDGSQINITSG
jgi:pentatricopeptide repeat protein